MNSNRILPAIMHTTRLLRSTLPPAYTFRLRYLRSWTLRASCGLRCHPRTLFACVTCDHGLYVPPAVYVATCVQLSPALPAIMDTTRLLRSTLPPAYTFRLRYLRSWTLRASCGLRCHPRTLFACVTCDHGLYVPPAVYVATMDTTPTGSKVTKQGRVPTLVMAVFVV